MAGTKAGGIKAARTNKLRNGEDFYAKIGKMGGMKSTGGGFASMTHEQVSACGKKGGCRGRRGAQIRSELENIIVSEVKSGRPFTAVAKEYGLSPSTVSRVYRRNDSV